MIGVAVWRPYSRVQCEDDPPEHTPPSHPERSRGILLGKRNRLRALMCGFPCVRGRFLYTVGDSEALGRSLDFARDDGLGCELVVPVWLSFSDWAIRRL